MKTQVVIARYNENLNWVNKLYSDYLIYNKGGPIIYPSYRLPNIGREAHTFLFHIVNNYNSLADVTFFLQGNPLEHQSDIINRIHCAYDYPTSLTTQYTDTFPSDEIKSYDRIETVNGFDVRYGDARYFGGKDATEHIPLLWNKVFECPQPDPWIFGYSAQYAVPRHYILRRSIDEWNHLLTQVINKELSAYCMEAVWYYLFTTHFKLKI